MIVMEHRGAAANDLYVLVGIRLNESKFTWDGEIYG